MSSLECFEIQIICSSFAEFLYYNFFTTDERVSNSEPQDWWTTGIDSIRLSVLEDVNPRYVRLEWDPITPSYTLAEASMDAMSSVIEEYHDYIQSELAIQTGRYNSIILEENNLASSIASELEAASRIRHLNTGSSATVSAYSLMSQTQENVDITTLLDAGNLYENTGLTFIDPTTSEIIEPITLDAGASSISATLESRVLVDVMAACSEAPFSAFYSDTSVSLDSAETRLSINSINN